MNNLIGVIKRNSEPYLTKDVMSIRYNSGEYKKCTYAEMFSEVDILSKRFISIGLQPGDRVIIVAENSPEWVMSFLAIVSIDCTAVLIDPSLRVSEIMDLISSSDARAVLLSPTVKRKLNQRVSNRIPVLNLLDKASAFDDEMEKSVLGEKTIDPDREVAVIIYSSGTTRRATGVMHTHDALVGTTEAAIEFNRLDNHDKMLVVIPLYHIYGVITSMLGPLMLGASMHFIETMSGEKVLQAFSEFKPTVFACVPRVFDVFKEQIASKIEAKGAFLMNTVLPACLAARKNLGINLGKKIFKSVHEGFGGNIRIFCAAGSPLDRETADFFYALGFNLFLNYGLTETNVPIVANNFDNYTLHSCGKAYSQVQVKIMDSDGSGELLVKTPFMMKGYFRDEVSTRESFDEEGWFKTGDIASMDENQNISITGRIKDNIVLGTGKKISPDTVEEGFLGIPGVKELVVCGIPPVGGLYDEIHVFVVPEGDPTQIETELFSREGSVSQHVKIKEVHFVDEIPRTSLQKPKRYVLKQKYIQENTKLAVSVSKEKEPIDFESELYTIIRDIKNRNIDIAHHMNVTRDLGLDSLDIMSLDSRVEEKTGKSIYRILRADTTIGEIIQGFYNLNSEGNAKGRYDFSRFPYPRGLVDNVAFSIAKRAAKVLYKVEVKGIENLPKDGGFILCPNHETNMDAFFVMMNLPKQYYARMCCMAKREALSEKNPITRSIMRIAGVIPVDRTGNTIPAMRRCLEKLQESSVVLIHPEGTRSEDGTMGVFKSGASKLSLDSNRPIIPVKIKGAYHIYPKGKALPKLFNIKKVKRYRLEIIFGDPIEPSGVDIPALTLKLRETIFSL